jgi:hypothetical protein
MEAEYMALCAATKEAVWLRTLLKELGHEQQQPTVIYEDNQACISLAKATSYHKKAKHIDIKYHYTREHINNGSVEIKYIPTENQLGDLMTKPLARVRFELLTDALQICPRTSAKEGVLNTPLARALALLVRLSES